ncbi:LAMI_0D05094g1_1 [Lachancea mirantina]|uniref:LAMI_0D05094g1_1 n=1 Tax=Lachancea mirantina TaxID=1230905 RepID=A0A1G4JAX5_9SACH|nr:LAMI_0D05094g1_1 [Lachancea mirantina]
MAIATTEGGVAMGSGTIPPIRPVIEVATYAGVDVYECYCRGQEARIVMRRCADDWINITQVFKIASFSKTQRTKILEKESNRIKHEKIQGGYGRFQGTWISLENAHYLVQKYSVNDIVVSAILNFELDPNDPPQRRTKNSVIKRQSPGTKIHSPSSYNKTPKKTSESLMKKTTAAKKKSNAVQPSPLQNLVFQTPQHQQQMVSSQQNNSTVVAPDQETPLHGSSYETTQKPLQFFPYPQQQPAFLTFDASNPSQPLSQRSNKIAKKSGKHAQVRHTFHAMKQQFRVQQQQRQPQQSQQPPVMVIQPSSHRTSQSNGSNGSSFECFSTQDNPTPMSSRSISPRNKSPDSAKAKDGEATEVSHQQNYKEMLLQVLSCDYSEVDQKSIFLPEELFHPPAGLDVNFTVDDQGHTTLHWAAAMANVPLIKLLLTLPVNFLQCNDRGFTAITKACFYNNCYNAGAFPQVLELLKPCIITPDMNGRLPFHYLVELSVNKSKDPVIINYYMDCILDLLGKEDISLLKMCLNYQDNMGNTALHLAALNLNLELCNKLCYLGSSMDIVNLDNENAASILAKFSLVPPTSQPMDGIPHAHVGTAAPTQDRQLKLSTPLMTRKKSNSFVQGDDYTVNLTQELSSLSHSQNSILTSTAVKEPKRHVTDPNAEQSWTGDTAVHAVTDKEFEGSVSLDPTATLNSSQSLVKQLSGLTATLTNSVDEKIGGLELEIDKTRECIDGIRQSLQHNNAHEKQILNDFSTREELHADVNRISRQAENQMGQLNNAIEKSQALALATLVHEEESRVNSVCDSPEASVAQSPVKVINDEMLCMGLELTLMQLRRKHMVEQLSRSKCEVNSTSKIKKYRKLIGMTIDGIDSKLQDIEQDLMATV